MHVTLCIFNSDTNCTAKETLVNKIILLYADSTAVQTTNTFLTQTSVYLDDVLNNLVILLYANYKPSTHSWPIFHKVGIKCSTIQTKPLSILMMMK